jgi:hypothetical protein
MQTIDENKKPEEVVELEIIELQAAAYTCCHFTF